ncbi:hypothetical protein [Azotosporobacter soli]|uniref:hypothetical protein n=1 Tax=Azotosporobacter soli TaxID=3055040 RepID=UPI0031FF0673
MLTLIQKDALTELFNLYIRQAADTLTESLEVKIQIQLSNAEIITTDKWDAYFKLHGEAQRGTDAATAHFLKEKLGIKPLRLRFPAGEAGWIAEACLKQADGALIPCEAQRKDLEADVIKEWSNVVLNAVSEGIGELLGRRIECAIPEVAPLAAWEEESSSEKEAVMQAVLLLPLHVVFLAAERECRLLITMKGQLVAEMAHKLEEILAGEGAAHGYVLE